MPQLVISSSSQTVKYNEFSQTVNASFSGLSGPIRNALITVFIPDYLSYSLPPITPPLKEIRTKPQEGQTLVTFDFGDINNTGQTIVLLLSMNFKYGTKNFTEFVTTYEMFVDGELIMSEQTLPVTLSLSPDWVLEKRMVIPADGGPTAGSTAFYLVQLRNRGDSPALISNVTVTDTMPDLLTLDPTFTPIGEDRSNTDPSADAPGVIDGQTVTFTLDSYTGNNYYMIYKVRLSNEAEIGSVIENTVRWTIDGEPMESVSSETFVSDSYFNAALGIYGPVTSKAGNLIAYELYLKNSGNQDINDAYVIHKIPEDVVINSVYPGSYAIPVINEFPDANYRLSYELNNSGSFTQIADYPYRYTNDRAFTDLTEFTPSASDKITALRWDFPVAPVGISQFHAPKINGAINESSTADSITSDVELNWVLDGSLNQLTESATTNLTGISDLHGNLYRSPGKSLIPQDLITYQGVYSGWYSQIDNPIYLHFIPPELEYVGNLRIGYSDYFLNWAYFTPETPDTVLPQPKVTVINDFEYEGELTTFLKVELSPFSITQRSQLYISYDCRVKSGAIGKFKTHVLLASRGRSQVTSASTVSEYPDVFDYDADGFTDNDILARTRSVSNTIRFSTSLAIEKAVKGELDEEYTKEPEIGLTTEGGHADYKITIKNIGNATIESFELVDILPHPNDTGVILIKEPRGSTFAINLTDTISAQIIGLLPGQDPPNLLIEYSKSYDPVRFNQQGNGTIGTVNDWSTTVSGPPSEIKSIKITSDPARLFPGQTLEILMRGIAPVGTKSSQIAANSIALKGTYYDPSGNLTALLPTEPAKTNLRIADPTDLVSIGEYVWIDQNQNGIKDPEEPGVNGVTVELLNLQQKVVRTTITGDDSTGEPGYYLFPALPPGTYRVRFKAPYGYKITKRYTGSEPVIGSVPSRLSGVTNAISLPNGGTTNRAISAGIYKYIDINQEIGLDLIFGSIGTEGLSMSHLVNAEAEKVQYFLGTLEAADRAPSSKDEILNANTMANRVLRDIIKNEMLISTKLEDGKDMTKE